MEKINPELKQLMKNDRWVAVSRYPNLSEEFIDKHKDEVYWSCISENQKLSEEFIDKHQDEVYWRYISQFQVLSEEFIEKHQDKVDWRYISQFQVLSEEFIDKHQDKVNWYCISSYQVLSEEFIEKHKDKLDIKMIERIKGHRISVQEYAKKHGLKIDDQYLYAYRNHDKNGSGVFKKTLRYQKGVYYRDWHCDTNPFNRCSFGYGIWPKGNTLVRIKLEDWGTQVIEDYSGKARVWGFEIVE